MLWVPGGRYGGTTIPLLRRRSPPDPSGSCDLDYGLEFNDQSSHQVWTVRGSLKTPVDASTILQRTHGLMLDVTNNYDPLPLGIRQFSRNGTRFSIVLEQSPSIQYVSYRPGSYKGRDAEVYEYSITTPWVVFILSGSFLTARSHPPLGLSDCQVYCRSSQLTPDDTALYEYRLPNLRPTGNACLGDSLAAQASLGSFCANFITHFWYRRYNDEIQVSYNRHTVLRNYEGLSIEEACKTIPRRKTYTSLEQADPLRGMYGAYSNHAADLAFLTNAAV